MIPVILSGGSGSRLWPLSRKQYPKQFLNLLGDHTLLQQTVMRLPEKGFGRPFLVCNHLHRFIVREQLQAIQRDPYTVLLEPFGRNTAPAVTLAAMMIAEEAPADDLMLVLPADHVIRDVPAFHAALERGRVQAEQGKLVLFGIVPTAPETGYGYVKSTTVNGVQPVPVERFVEKPNLETAVQFLASGDYFWNSGMFLFSASRFLEEVRALQPDIYDTCYLTLQRKYRDLDFWRLDADSFAFCPDDSIDYAIMEKTRDAVVVPLQAGWSDVGSWSALWEEQERDEHNNFLKGNVNVRGTENCYVHTTHRMVSLIGMQDTVVIETKDAVLVAARDQVQDVKNVVKYLEQHDRQEAQHHREVFRPWGSYDAIDQGVRFGVKHITVQPGQSLSLHRHLHRAEHWVVVRGVGEVTIGDDTYLMTENQSTYIPQGEYHRLANPGKVPLEIIEVQTGTFLDDEDIDRVADVYGRVNPHDSPVSSQALMASGVRVMNNR
ncbi:TPA: mannose-1-phosphate guanylyltransferase/mannose-6-phosphate isomerase [Escherichia coli]|nr:mannose-1-phosphate guanylyltransferase/mannose-6-phosphate isomerase [Escherichia coli]